MMMTFDTLENVLNCNDPYDIRFKCPYCNHTTNINFNRNIIYTVKDDIIIRCNYCNHIVYMLKPLWNGDKSIKESEISQILTPIDKIDSITEEDITELTKLFNCSENNPVLDDTKLNILNYFVDKYILYRLDTEHLMDLYNLVKELVENRIEYIIKTNYNEIKLPVGTMVKIKPKYLEPKEDSIYDYENKMGVITRSIRLASDEFHQGWYMYNIKFDGIPNVVTLYRKEFKVIETI